MQSINMREILLGFIIFVTSNILVKHKVKGHYGTSVSFFGTLVSQVSVVSIYLKQKKCPLD